METLFESSAKTDTQALGKTPLAARMRPQKLDDVVGQGHLLRSGSSLREVIEGDRPTSLILYGPPGSGKTTLARIVANHSQSAFEELSAVAAGRPEVRELLERARERLSLNGRSTIFFLDEIHRFNKAQQDALLPAVEDGLIALIGATTENPYFEVNSALLSRCQIFELKKLGSEEMLGLLKEALASDSKLSQLELEIDDGVLEFIAERSGGDARSAYNTLELACETAEGLKSSLSLELAESASQKKALTYDRDGDQHYDYISAFIKAMRGSDPDAAIYYLAVMLEGGEDPRFIVRRMVIFASEDVGNADPQALLIATAAAQAVDRVGLPECKINLSQAVAYLALAQKSNAAIEAISRATGDVRREGAAPPPDYLRDSHYPGAKEFGRGQGYDYPHSNEGAASKQELMPDAVKGRKYYEPKKR